MRDQEHRGEPLIEKGEEAATHSGKASENISSPEIISL